MNEAFGVPRAAMVRRDALALCDLPGAGATGIALRRPVLAPRRPNSTAAWCAARPPAGNAGRARHTDLIEGCVLATDARRLTRLPFAAGSLAASGCREAAASEDGLPKANGSRGWRARAIKSAIAVALVLFAASAQAQQPAPQPAQQPAPRRKALEIRGQAPAPEVVTVRPREVPQFTRKLIAPALYDAPPASRSRSTVVLLPGPLPELRPPVTNPTRPPE